MTSRVHGPALTAAAAATTDGELIALPSPAVGWWRAQVVIGQVVQPGETLGELTILGTVYRVIAGAGAHGAVRPMAGGPRGPVAVDAASTLLTLDPSVATGVAAAADVGAAAAQPGGLTVRAPSSGRFYGRPGPGKPAFVNVGDVIREGHTVCLLEVMKTFHRVTYGGGGLPAEAKVIAIAVADEADVNGGDVLLQLEAV